MADAEEEMENAPAGLIDFGTQQRAKAAQTLRAIENDPTLEQPTAALVAAQPLQTFLNYTFRSDALLGKLAVEEQFSSDGDGARKLRNECFATNIMFFNALRGNEVLQTCTAMILDLDHPNWLLLDTSLDARLDTAVSMTRSMTGAFLRLALPFEPCTPRAILFDACHVGGEPCYSRFVFTSAVFGSFCIGNSPPPLQACRHRPNTWRYLMPTP